MKINEKHEAALGFVLEQAIRLGATMGTWLNTDFKFANRVCFDVVEAMKPHFITEIKDRFRQIENEESGRCMYCGHKNERA